MVSAGLTVVGICAHNIHCGTWDVGRGAVAGRVLFYHKYGAWRGLQDSVGDASNNQAGKVGQST